MEDSVAVACADCPECGAENVYGRVDPARRGFNETTELTVSCKNCDEVFKIPKSELQIRYKPRGAVDAERGLGELRWIQ